MKRIYLLLFAVMVNCCLWAADSFVSFQPVENALSLKGAQILVDNREHSCVKRALANLKSDFIRVAHNAYCDSTADRKIVIGTVGVNRQIDQWVKKGLLTNLRGRTEKYIIKTIDNQLVIAGSDKRGTVYGIYELSRQMGVSPWYYWADVPVEHHENIYIKCGEYTDGEPSVRYRGIFLNDEAPCLTTWVKNTFGTRYGDHRFYEKVFELLLRLKANYMWPAMWNWSFYADDPENSRTADEMGIIMGTSHHEPMARNHEEWVRKRKEYGAWDYENNREIMDRFFREGMQRAKNTDDLITIGMRGDGDCAIGAREGHDSEYVPDDNASMKLLDKVVKAQRKIIADVTGRPAKERPQVWAMYKEVQRYYDKGLKVPDDVIVLFSDDNWGHIRRVPNKKQSSHKGGFGMYYHVDYVGAPRNSKWLNVTPIQHLWDQFTLTSQYGINKLWVLNVGDLKPMEYPITLFLDMAWDNKKYNVENLLLHTRGFCSEQFGKEQASEAARILNLYSQYAGRVTPEMLNAKTYNIETGEWKMVADEFSKLEADALTQFVTLPENRRDAYRQIILFPVQALSNLYQMYYAQAMNLKLYEENNPEANQWADRVEETLKRDAELCRGYNKDMAGGKWDGMMIQKHIGYTTWNDNFRADKLPEIKRFENPDIMKGNYVFESSEGYISMDAQHYYQITNAAEAKWTEVPFMGRTRGGMSLRPYNVATDESSISYRFELPEGVNEVNVHIVTASTLAFLRPEGHRYTVGFEGGDRVEVNFNGELNEDPKNVYSITYPTVATRVIEKITQLKVSSDKWATLVIHPLDPGTMFEKIIIDFGGYQKQFLFGKESKCRRLSL